MTVRGPLVRYRPVRATMIASIVAVLFGSGIARAQTSIVWANAGSDFATGANWAGGVAPADNTTSNRASFGTVTVQPVLASSRSVAGLVFTGTDAATLTGSGTLTLGGSSSLTNSSTIGTKTVSVPLTFSVFRSTIANNGDLRLGGPIAGFTLLTFFDAGTGAGGVITGDMSNDLLTKTGPGLLTLTGSSNMSSGVTVSGGTLRLGASNRLSNTAPFTVDAGATFDLAGASEEIGNLSGAGAVTLGTGTLTTGTASGVTFSGVISGSGGLAKVGSSTFVLSGSNTYTGSTTVAAGGMLAIGAGGTTGSIVSDVLVGGSIAFNRSDAFTYGGVISGTGRLVKQGSGRLTLAAAQTYTGTTTISTGTLALGANNGLSAATRVSIASGAVLDLDGRSTAIGSLTGAGSVLLGSGTLTSGALTSYTEFSGRMSGSGGFVKSGSTTLTLTGSSSYTGGTTVSGGTLAIAGAQAIPQGTAVTIAAGATLSRNISITSGTLGSLAGAGTLTIPVGQMTIGSDGSSTTFAGLIDGSADITGSGTLTLTGTASGGTVLVTGNRLVVDGTGVILSDLDVFANLTARGSSVIASSFISNTGYMELRDTATFGAASITGTGNIYTYGTSSLGTATITVSGLLSLWEQSSAGTATITNNAVLLVNQSASTGTAAITNSGTLQLRDQSSAAGSTIVNAAGGIVDASAVIFAGTAPIGALSGGGTLALGDRSVAIGARNATTTFSGIITGTGGGLTKVGTGGLTLSANSGFSGATRVTAGRLTISGTLSSSAVTVESTGVLAGDGIVSQLVTVQDTGTVSPGNAAPSYGTLGVGGLSLGSTATVSLAITGTSRGVSYDGIDVLGGGPLTYGGTLDLSASVIDGAAIGTSYRLFDFTNGSTGNLAAITPLSGEYAAITWSGPAGGVWTSSTGSGGNSLRFTQSTGVLAVVPEPAGAALIVAGLVAIVACRRSRGVALSAG